MPRVMNNAATHAFQQAFTAGMTTIQRGDYRAALQHLQVAAQLNPGHLDTRYNLARLHEELCEPLPALQAYEVCVQAQPRWPAAWNNRGNVLRALGRLDEALASYRKCLEIDPSVAAFVLPNLARTAFDLRDFAQAARHCESALMLSPQQPELWLLAGHARRELRRFDEALAAYRQALTLNPGLREAQLALAHVSFDRLALPEARATLDACLQRQPLDAEAQWSRVALSVPPLLTTADTDASEMEAQAHTDLTQALDQLEQQQHAHPEHPWHDGAVAKTLFYLAYESGNHRDVLTRFGDLARQAMAGVQPPSVPGPRGTGRIRVGIVSEYLRAHSVWEALVQGWVQHLDREHFEVHLFHAGRIEDAQTERARALSEGFTTLPNEVRDAATQIAAAQMDALIFPDLGISARSYRLASLRLAPVQLASWGHPETSGLRHLEGFLSADALEPAQAQAHYIEPLIRLPHLGCCIAPIDDAPVAPLDREALGLTHRGPLLVCGGTPFKYRPVFDEVAVQIAQRLPEARLVFFDYSANPWYSNALKQRLTRRFEQAGLSAQDHLHWLPWLSGPQFLGLMRGADVFLDSIGFSGFNTAVQALHAQLPVVAWEGEHLRARLASGVLHHLGLDDGVASDTTTYVDIATRLAADPGAREDYRRRLQPQMARVFDDRAPVRALEQWLRTSAQR